jgi:hypothetical protein
VGIELPVYEREALQLLVGADVSAKGFPDDLGPKIYAGGGLTFGMSYHVEGLP